MDDLQLRPARLSDIPAIGALVRRSEAADGLPRVLDDEELAQDLSASYIDLDLDTRVAQREGGIVGWAYVWHPPSQHRLERAELLGEVAPEHRGTGIGRTLLAWSLDRARDRLRARQHDLPRYVRAHTYDWLHVRQALYRRAGFEAVRWHDELLRDLEDLPAVDVPAGVTLLPWDSDRDEELRQVRNEAFADHWGSMVVEPELWHDFTQGHGSRTDLSVIAVDATGAVIGLCLNQAYPEDEAVTGRRDAWIANIGTLRSARGRGVATAMLVWSLAAFADAGFTHAMLDVDTDNPTGAARLYRNLGFDPHHRSITYQIEVDR